MQQVHSQTSNKTVTYCFDVKGETDAIIAKF